MMIKNGRNTLRKSCMPFISLKDFHVDVALPDTVQVAFVLYDQRYCFSLQIVSQYEVESPLRFHIAVGTKHERSGGFIANINLYVFNPVCRLYGMQNLSDGEIYRKDFTGLHFFRCTDDRDMQLFQFGLMFRIFEPVNALKKVFINLNRIKFFCENDASAAGDRQRAHGGALQ
jgi:hypothetical protein